MKFSLTLCVGLLAIVPTVVAQEPAEEKPATEPQAMPNPKHAEHAALQSMVGTWKCTAKSAAMPGVPGMEEPCEGESIDRTELLCDGLWLKSTIEGTNNGKPVQGVWLCGYDPYQKKYVGVWVDDGESAPMEMTGSYDAKTKTWRWSGDCAQGAMRSEMVWKDADTTVETCWMKPKGQEKEMQVAEITRTRMGDAVAVPAAASRGAESLSPEHRHLLKDVGEWKAVVRSSMDPSQPATEDTCHETVRSACRGRYTWSEFRGAMMGMPFEGHALAGYDTTAKQCVGYWIDSMSPVWSKTTGALDAGAKTLTMRGSSSDQNGKPMQIKQELTWKDADHRHLHMEFVTDEGTMPMDIEYERTSKG